MLAYHIQMLAPFNRAQLLSYNHMSLQAECATENSSTAGGAGGPAAGVLGDQRHIWKRVPGLCQRVWCPPGGALVPQPDLMLYIRLQDSARGNVPSDSAPWFFPDFHAIGRHQVVRYPLGRQEHLRELLLFAKTAVNHLC